MFEANQKETFPSREERILQFWKSKNIFEKSLTMRAKESRFSFYDGPPFATGLPHYGHLLAGTIKDVIPRYKTMQGYFVPRRFGWDCHGLPVENEIEKAKALSGAPEIESFGIAKFNEECRSIVFRYVQEWKYTVERMGRWVDFEKTYHTMDVTYMESVWWVFYELYAKGLVYEGFKVMPYSAKLGTPISNFEANLNYRDVDDPSLFITFSLSSESDTFLLVWTTTPWTLPANLALAVHPEIDYVKIVEKETGKKLILAKERLHAVFKEPQSYQILTTSKGKSLIGKHYEPVFSYFVEKRQEKAFQILEGEFVSTEEGTGIVHIAPAFGEEDFFLCSKSGIELVCPIDRNGKFTKEVPDFEGLFVKDADKEIVKFLKKQGKVFKYDQIRHRYPFCWRSDTPLIYKAVRTWFIAVEKIKEQLLANNEEIHWIPEHIKQGRFGKWLENARDWAVSRNRYWGAPIPLWRSSDGEIIVIGSIKELEARTNKKITDLHRHFIDDLTFEENGKLFHRVPEVFDCWFESGCMPYAQNHYPFENQEETMKMFPADFIGEGLDQTRGWFYTLHVLATALFQKPAFKNVIVNGIVLAENGVKMSKRLKNYPDPLKMIHQYGADAIRLFLLNSQAVVGDDLRFSEKGVEQCVRQILIPLWNCFVFLSTYAGIYHWKPKEEIPFQTDIDRWVLSKLQKLIDDVTKAMDRYALNQAVPPLVGFIEELTNWYIRRCRVRFWADEDSSDRRQAFATLYHVLFTFSQIIAPFIPFIAEAIYLQLRKDSDPESVHLCDYPKVQENLRDLALEQEMHLVQTIVSLGHFLRKEHKLKVRQPLTKAHLICMEMHLLEALKRQQKLIAEELNVHKLTFSGDESEYVILSCKPNFRALGKKVGPLMKAVQKEIENISQEQMVQLFSGKNVELSVGESLITLTPEDVLVERKVQEDFVAATSEGVTVVLDTHLTKELIEEGIARELVNKINTMRRENGFYVTDRIEVTIQSSSNIQKAFEAYEKYIMGEVLATAFHFAPCEGTDWDIQGEKTIISLLRIENAKSDEIKSEKKVSFPNT